MLVLASALVLVHSFVSHYTLTLSQAVFLRRDARATQDVLHLTRPSQVHPLVANSLGDPYLRAHDPPTTRIRSHPCFLLSHKSRMMTLLLSFIALARFRLCSLCEPSLFGVSRGNNL